MVNMPLWRQRRKQERAFIRNEEFDNSHNNRRRDFVTKWAFIRLFTGYCNVLEINLISFLCCEV
jgi:hypothetical protein